MGIIGYYCTSQERRFIALSNEPTPLYLSHSVEFTAKMGLRRRGVQVAVLHCLCVVAHCMALQTQINRNTEHQKFDFTALKYICQYIFKVSIFYDIPAHFSPGLHPLIKFKPWAWTAILIMQCNLQKRKRSDPTCQPGLSIVLLLGIWPLSLHAPCHVSHLFLPFGGGMSFPLLSDQKKSYLSLDAV